jgi:hypothetical protein
MKLHSFPETVFNEAIVRKPGGNVDCINFDRLASFMTDDETLALAKFLTDRVAARRALVERLRMERVQ